MVDDDKTQILTEGTEDYPLDATLASNVEPCPNCQTEIAIGSQFCSKCGYQRGTWDAADSPDSEAEWPGLESSPALYFLVNDDDRIGIPEGESVVGRGDVDLKLSDGYLSRQHAKFIASADSLEISDLGSANGSFIDDKRLEANEPAELTPGQSLKLGQTDYTIEKAEPAPASDSDSDGEAELPDSPEQSDPPDQIAPTDDNSPAEQSEGSLSPWSLEYGEGEVIELKLGETTLGRSAAKSDVAIVGDGFISSLHLKLTATADSLEAEDLGSTNGTKHNGESLQANKPILLAAGDTLEMGETKSVVCYSEHPTQSAETEIVEYEKHEAGPSLESSD